MLSCVSTALTFSDGSYVMCSLCALILAVFFFQAEDGIRDLVRSRGLGDVYKRQVTAYPEPLWPSGSGPFSLSPDGKLLLCVRVDPSAVSYTHLTLPTSDLV